MAPVGVVDGQVIGHLVPEKIKESYLAGIKAAYQQAFGRAITSLEVRPGPGAKALNPKFDT